MIEHVTIAGGGVLGSQIAIQTAVSGFKVTIYDVVEEGLDGAKNKIEQYIPRFEKESKKDYSHDELRQAADSISYTTDIKEAGKEADLVIEAIIEKLPVKKDFYQDLNQACPDHTLFATNTSTLLPSDFMAETGRPDQFLAIHFANEIWHRNIAEIMRTEKTSDESFDQAVDFAKAINMVPIPLFKEQSGYILNSLLRPFFNAGYYLLATSDCSAQDIDRAWIQATGAHDGPFSIVDHIGIETPKNILQDQVEADPDQAEDWLKDTVALFESMIDKGQGGKLDGKGFYDYDGSPAFQEEGFTDQASDIGFKDFGQTSQDPDKNRDQAIYTRLLTSVLEGALELYVKGVSEKDTIDQVWQITRDLEWGPFSVIQEIGPDQVYQVFKDRYGDQASDLENQVLEELKNE